MQDATLMMISCIIATLGLGVLLFVLLTQQAQLYDIENLKNLNDGSKVRIKGTIVTASIQGERTSLTITHPSSIDAVIFSPVNITKGSCVLVSGTTSTYNDEQQLIVRKLVRC